MPDDRPRRTVRPRSTSSSRRSSCARASCWGRARRARRDGRRRGGRTAPSSYSTSSVSKFWCSVSAAPARRRGAWPPRPARRCHVPMPYSPTGRARARPDRGCGCSSPPSRSSARSVVGRRARRSPWPSPGLRGDPREGVAQRRPDADGLARRGHRVGGERGARLHEARDPVADHLDAGQQRAGILVVVVERVEPGAVEADLAAVAAGRADGVRRVGDRPARQVQRRVVVGLDETRMHDGAAASRSAAGR